MEQITATGRDVPPAVAADVPAAAGSNDEEEAPGLLEHLAEAEDAAPELGTILADLTHEIARLGEIVEAASKRMADADARGQGVKGRLVITEKMSQQLEQPAERIQDLGHRFAALLVKLDPAILTALDFASAADEIDPATIEFLQLLENLAAEVQPALASLDSLLGELAQASTLSRSLRSPLGRIQTGLKGVLDGRAIIENWAHRADEIRRPPEDDASTS